jgi:hypothetical protein
MKKATSGLAAILVLFLGVGLMQARDRHAPVPSKILTAHTVYVDNQTPDAELQLDAVMGLSKWGRFDIVDNPQKADIVLRLIGSTFVKYVPVQQVPAKYDPKPVTPYAADGEELAPAGYTRLEVVEPKGGGLLWEEIRKTNNVQERARLIEGLHEAVDQQERTRR